MPRLLVNTVCIPKNKRAKALKALKGQFSFNVTAETKSLKTALTGLGVQVNIAENGDVSFLESSENLGMVLNIVEAIPECFTDGEIIVLYNDQTIERTVVRNGRAKSHEGSLLFHQDTEELAEEVIHEWLVWLVSDEDREETDLHAKTAEELSLLLIEDIKSGKVKDLDLGGLRDYLEEVIQDGRNK